MFVSDWMTKKVYTVSPDDSISDAVRMMKERKIKHLPVLKEGKIKGMVSDRDIKEFTPSSATTLDIYELHYILAKAKVKDIMKTKVTTTTPETPVEEAAMVLYDRMIGCLPVVENGRLVGIISDRDIFHALIDITGVRHGGNRVYLSIEDRPGSIKEVADIIRKYGFSMQSILTSYEGVEDGCRNIVIRTKGKGSFIGLRSELEKKYKGVKVRKG
ncbi:MAG: CBS and ACT domain-containing protein [Nitrospirota bacterium]